MFHLQVYIEMPSQQNIKNGLTLFFNGRYGSTLTHCFSVFFSRALLLHYKRFTCTTLTIRNVHVPLFTANINAYFQDIGLPGWFTGWQVSGIQTCQPGKKTTLWVSHISQCCLSNSVRNMTEMCLWLHMKNETVFWYTIYKCFSLHFNTFKTMLIVQLTFMHFNKWNNNS